MIKDIVILVGAFLFGVAATFGGAVMFAPKTHGGVATNGRYVGVIETGDGTAEAIAFRSKEVCEQAALKMRAIIADPDNADKIAAAGGKVWMMPCTPVVSELITK